MARNVESSEVHITENGISFVGSIFGICTNKTLQPKKALTPESQSANPVSQSTYPHAWVEANKQKVRAVP